jgi:hypothetical protein
MPTRPKYVRTENLQVTVTKDEMRKIDKARAPLGVSRSTWGREIIRRELLAQAVDRSRTNVEEAMQDAKD